MFSIPQLLLLTSMTDLFGGLDVCTAGEDVMKEEEEENMI